MGIWFWILFKITWWCPRLLLVSGVVTNSDGEIAPPINCCAAWFCVEVCGSSMFETPILELVKFIPVSGVVVNPAMLLWIFVVSVGIELWRPFRPVLDMQPGWMLGWSAEKGNDFCQIVGWLTFHISGLFFLTDSQKTGVRYRLRQIHLNIAHTIDNWNWKNSIHYCRSRSVNRSTSIPNGCTSTCPQ